jgi:hypothetical protein
MVRVANDFATHSGRVYDIKNLLQFAEEFNDLQNNCPWSTIVIDSFTSFSVTCVTFQLDVRTTDKDKKTSVSKGGLVIPDFDEYKGETTLVTQALDVSKVLPCHVIWTVHPLPKLDTSGQGAGMKVTKTTSIAAYGAKTAAMAPGYFNEVWHLEARSAAGGVQRITHTQTIGDQFAKSALPLAGYQFDVTNKARGLQRCRQFLEEYHIKLQEHISTSGEGGTAHTERLRSCKDSLLIVQG